MKKLIVFIILLSATFSFSADWWEKIRINGFLSQSYLKSSDNNFLAPNSTDGTFEVNELGLTISSQLSDKLRVGMQLLARDMGDIGNNEVKLDWAFADYHYSDYLGLRVGKVKLPFGLYNEARDTDFLRATAFLPQGLYDETKRGFMIAYQGIGIYGNLGLGVAGDVDYHFYGGTLNVEDDDIAIQYFGQVWNYSYLYGYKPYLDMFGYEGDLTVKGLHSRSNGLWGGQVIWNTGIDGLRLAYSYYHADSDLEYSDTKSYIGDFEVKGWFVASVEYSIGNFVFSSEYSEMEAYVGMFEYVNDALPVTVIQPLLDLTTQDWYVMLSYSFTDKFTVTVLYDEYYADKDDKEGNYYVEHGLPAHMGWRKDTAISLRYDVNFNWTLKLEYHDVDGAALFMSVVNPQGLAKDWTYTIVKASFNF
jgi:hypothetical protein